MLQNDRADYKKKGTISAVFTLQPDNFATILPRQSQAWR